MGKLLRCKVAAVAALFALLTPALYAATRVWSQTDGIWSTRPEDTPFTGRSFSDYDDVIFNDPENLSLDGALTANVTVHGVVLPSTITFNNNSAIYFAESENAESSIGTDAELGRVQFIYKNGWAPTTIDTPVHYKNIEVNEGTLTLNNMPGAANSIKLQPGTTFNFRYTGSIMQQLFSSYTMEADSTFHRIGKARFATASFPPRDENGNPQSDTFKSGARVLFDEMEVDGLVYVGDGVHVEALESADIHVLNVWDKGLFRMTGKTDPSRTNRIDEIDVMREGVVQLKEGYFNIGSLTTNETVAAEVVSGTAANGRLVVGGDPSNTNRTYFTYDAPPGIVYTQNEFIGNTEALMPEVTVGGNPKANSYLFATNGANVRITGKLIFGGGDSTERIRRLTIADNATVHIDGYLDFSEVGREDGKYEGKGDARVMVSGNSVFSTAGIHYGKYDDVNQIRQVFVSDGAEFELGGNNDGDKIAKTLNTSTPSVSQTVCTPQTRPFILDNGTLRFTEDQIFDQALFLQEFSTNTIDLAGHTVTNKSALLPYFKGEAKSQRGKETEERSISRLIIADSSPEQTGFLYLEPDYYGVRNGNNEAEPKKVPGYNAVAYGTQLYGGRLRVSTSQSSSVGFSLYGGILELPVGTDYPTYVRDSYTNLSNKYDKVLASVWHSEVGATIRCYVSSKDKLIRSSETNKWQVVCNVNVSGGLKIDDFMRLTTFELIEEDTGKMLSGASFHAATSNSKNHYVIYMTYEDNEMDESSKTITDLYWCGGIGEDRKWTNEMNDQPEWLDQDGKQASYIDEVNVHFTNLVERLKLMVERKTDDKLQEYDSVTDTWTDHSDQVVYSNSVPVVAESLTFTNCQDVCIKTGETLETGSLINTPFLSVSDSVVDLDTYVVSEGKIEVVDSDENGGTLLMATNLVHRSRWFVSKGATFHAGYYSPEVTFSTMSHTITNFGKVIYNFNGRTEKITQPLAYPTDAYSEGDECYYEFVNGTLDFAGVDYLARRANTNVWISTGCVRHIIGSGNVRSVVSASSDSPLGYKNGGMLQVDVPYRASKGSVLKNSASFQLNDVFTMVPGSSISVLECDDNTYAGCIEINGSENGALAFDNNGSNGATFETTPFRFYTAAGETNKVNVALIGENANIVVEGEGTLYLGDCPSTVSGTLTVKSGAKLVVSGTQSLGALDVIVESGGAIIFTESGRPQKLCKTLTLRNDAIVGLGPASSVIEPQNPVQILELGQVIAEGNIKAVTSYDESVYAAGSYGIANENSNRYYNNARAFQGHSIELFGLLGDLIWDTGNSEGCWFSTTTVLVTGKQPGEENGPNVLSFWHPAKSYNTLLGYDANAPFTDFQNMQSNAVTFLSAADVVVSNYVGESAAPLLPSAITFASDYNENAAVEAGQTNHLHITAKDGAQVLGTEPSPVIVLAAHTHDTVQAVPIWARSITVDKLSYLSMPKILSAPESVIVEGGSRLAYGSGLDNDLFTLSVMNFRGEGRLDKIGSRLVTFNVEGENEVNNAIGVCEGKLKIAGSTPTLFKGDLWFEPYQGAEGSFEGVANWLTLENDAGEYGWVFDGSNGDGLVVTVATNAVLSGNAFGTMGDVDIVIATNSTLVVDAPIIEYKGNRTAITVSGGTTQFKAGLGPVEIMRHTSASTVDFDDDTRVELHNCHLHSKKTAFGGTLVPVLEDSSFAEDVRYWTVTVPGCTIDAEDADAPSDFPLPVWLNVSNDNGVLAELQKSYGKIAAYAWDEATKELSEIAYEYDSYVEDKGALVWLSVPKLSKEFKAYFVMSGDSPRTKPATDVWKDYTAVWHFNVANDGAMSESTSNHWETTYHYQTGSSFGFNADNYAKWHTNDVNMLGYGFTFNDSSVAWGYDGFLVTNDLVAALSGSEGLSVEGFFEVANDTAQWQKLLCYRPNTGYCLSWMGGENNDGILKGTQLGFAYDGGFGQLRNIDTKEMLNSSLTYKKGEWFFAGVSMGTNAAQTVSMGGLKDFYSTTKQSYNGGVDDASTISDGTLSNSLRVGGVADVVKNSVAIGFRTDNTTEAGQNFRGVMDEVRIRRGAAPSALWTQTVATSATNGYVAVESSVISAAYNGVCATESIMLGQDSTIEIDRLCTNDKALVFDLTYPGAKLVTSANDASVTIDLTKFGQLEDTDDGTTLIKVLGETSVNIFTFALKLNDVNSAEKKEKWALRAYSFREDGDKVTLIQLVKAQGAVLVISPAESGDIWSSTLPESTREFNSDGRDFAVIPRNYNASTNLHAGAVIRDKFGDHTDGVTTDMVIGNIMNSEATPNTDYWFWFEGSNGAWSEPGNYTLNLTNETTSGGLTIDETSTIYVQFAVTNQIFYGQSTSTLNSGELGFYVTYDPTDGTNLVARILNTPNDVKIPIDDITEPWLVVTVAVKPYDGYEISLGNQTRMLKTSFAEHPQQIRITGVAPVDNIFVSTGNPNRNKLVYVHDMTRIGGDEVNGWKWADRPLYLTEEYFERITKKIEDAGYQYNKPTSANPNVGVMPVSFRSRVRQGGKIIDSDEVGSPSASATGDEHISLVNMLHLSTVVELNSENPGETQTAKLYPAKSSEYGDLKVYKLNYEYALGIYSVTRHVNNAVTIYSVLSDSAESYAEDHLQGSGENVHELNGYLYIESTESPTPYKTNTVWKPVSISARPEFGDNHLNETFVAAPVINSNQTFRVRVNKVRPTVDK